MKQSLSFLLAHLSVGIAKHEPNCRKKVTLARAIAPNDDIMLGRERLDDSLFTIAIELSVKIHREGGHAQPFEALNNDLLDMHLESRMRAISALNQEQPLTLARACE